MELSSWQPFADDADVSIPNGPERGRVVALLGPRYDTGESWAAALAFDVAARWAGSGHKIVVADAALEHPTLHRHVGLPNEEGVTDAARFGASVARIARPVPGRSFFLVTAGSPAGDGALVAASARWRRLVDGFGEAGVTLVLFLREGGAGVEAFLASAADVVVLAAPGEAPPAVPAEARARVRAVLGPDGNAAAPLDALGPTGDGPGTDNREPGSAGPTAHDGPVTAERDRVDRYEAARDPQGGHEPARDPLDHLLGAEEGSGEPEGGHASVGAGTRKRGGSDPDARRKLIWVALVVLAVVAFILIGALGTG